MDLNTLKARHLQARKASRTDADSAATAAVLSRVLGDAETQAKNKPGTAQIDLIAAVTTAQRTSLEKELQDLTRLGRDTATTSQELPILQALNDEILTLKAGQDAEKAASLMSEDELAGVIARAVASGADNIGAVMNVLKMDHAGQYDGSAASRLARQALLPR
ncbi:GatB/YqeY domain-containing protein [Deinococcus sp. QL22]|uniref:GatB/YqeY domain-containing protein n=1 Tax=Deinococcus sp. QL22 TaxID=2939437 RepID=UPI0020183C77|nr:GatB/YqeY domain-containing protein [Deinococcus sp. QL22]UQN08850.1 GatB/YqeY domain-containing protein [Deinococcus sp. QL22]